MKTCEAGGGTIEVSSGTAMVIGIIVGVVVLCCIGACLYKKFCRKGGQQTIVKVVHVQAAPAPKRKKKVKRKSKSRKKPRRDDATHSSYESDSESEHTDPDFAQTTIIHLNGETPAPDEEQPVEGEPVEEEQP